MKKKFGAIVALLIVASLSVAGCTKVATNTNAPATQPDQQLTEYIENYNTTLKNEHPNNLTAWLVTPINRTSVQIQDAWTDALTSTSIANVTYSENVTVMRFGSLNEATAYVNGQNAGYRLVATSYPSTFSPEANQRAKGNATTAYAIYTTGNGVGAPSKQIVLIDQFVWIGDFQYLPSAP
jgi:curli biogenesis system outer membrane secretion channel CsgG